MVPLPITTRRAPIAIRMRQTAIRRHPIRIRRQATVTSPVDSVAPDMTAAARPAIRPHSHAAGPHANGVTLRFPGIRSHAIGTWLQRCVIGRPRHVTTRPTRWTLRSIAPRRAWNRCKRPARRRSHPKPRAIDRAPTMGARSRHRTGVRRLEIALRLPATGFRPLRIVLTQQPSVRPLASRLARSDATVESQRCSGRSTVPAGGMGYLSLRTSTLIVSHFPTKSMIKTSGTIGSNTSSG